ncbi:hypothetical protein GWK47_026680 [Chionoecetes opilio]|uniref:Uncharacterized protein n=1 Tax=Chionoecetes opilio TaxID=41210 RepID=A0A8J8WED3_CHIOP|nr:hypothetical protein GWK47_026680 [Chionoecetes opilio]
MIIPVIPTPPPHNPVMHVRAMQREELPGFYNTTCGPFSVTSCITQFNLQCVDGRCLCFDSYVPNDSGGCKEDMMTVMVTWIVRVFVTACFFLVFFTIFRLIAARRCDWRRGPQREEDDTNDRSNRSCWYDEPPPYFEATEDLPPPTYQEAVAKECENGSEAQRSPAERVIHCTDVPARAPNRGVQTVSPTSLPRPIQINTQDDQQTIHM